MYINQYAVVFIFWNVFLALIPCWTVYYLMTHKKARRSRLIFGLLFLFWLFMLPNTAYLFLVTRHIVDYCWNYDSYRVCVEQGSWMPFFFFTYALAGLPTFYYALKKMTRMTHRYLPLGIIPLTSIGLMFGLFERFNSWDVLTKPITLLQTAMAYFLRPERLTDFVVFTILLYLIYYVTDFLIRKHDQGPS